ncbi:MAG: glycosyltransferase [Methanothrix sp.]|nr:glycosyltransferase [Methanothrix sp.]MDD4447761.1 glycosyltransferase [Methanothrix sp.]
MDKGTVRQQMWQANCQATDTQSLKGIKYISLYGANGYFIAAKRYMIGLQNFGIPFIWTPLVRGADNELGPFTGDNIGDTQLDHFCNKQINYDTVIIHTPPEYYPYWIDKEKDKRIFGYTVWETDKLPAHWPNLLNLVDHVLVPCQWNKEVFIKSGVYKPIDVIPHISDGFRPSADGHRLRCAISPSDFVFYTIETWTARKAVWNTIKYYLDTFTGNDPVLLVVKTTKYAYNDSQLEQFKKMNIFKENLNIIKKAAPIINLIRRKKDTQNALSSIQRNYAFPARIMLINETLTDNEIMDLHNRGDCYISLCRSEGWGLGPFTAAGMGKPVIITGFGGHLDFLPEELAYLVSYDLVMVRDDWDRKRFAEDMMWAEPKKFQACQLMRHVFENQNEARKRGEALSKFVNDGFSEDKVMQRFIAALVQGKFRQSGEIDGTNIYK